MLAETAILDMQQYAHTSRLHGSSTGPCNTSMHTAHIRLAQFLNIEGYY